MIYQLKDSDNESVGLITASDQNKDKIAQLWCDWYAETDLEISPENFCDYLRENNIIADCIYVTDLLALYSY